MDYMAIEKYTFWLALLFYLFSAFIYIYYLSFRQDRIVKIAPFLIGAGLIFNTVSLAFRWLEAGHPPLWTLYEVSSFFAWCVAVIYLIIEFYTKQRIIGAFVMPLNIVVMGLGWSNFEGPTQLLPALQSPWLVIHVTIAFISYAAFLVALGMAYLYLLQEHFMKKQFSGVVKMIVSSFVIIGIMIWLFLVSPKLAGLFSRGQEMAGLQLVLFELLGGIFFGTLGALGGYALGTRAATPTFSLRLPPLEVLDDLSYRSIAFGFPMLTLAIITGSVWAHKAWGTYWAWDPKETWSLITWFIYAAYMHAHNIAGWRGRRAAILAVIGFIGVIITFLGLNWINKFINIGSLHLYI